VADLLDKQARALGLTLPAIVAQDIFIGAAVYDQYRTGRKDKDIVSMAEVYVDLGREVRDKFVDRMLRHAEVTYSNLKSVLYGLPAAQRARAEELLGRGMSGVHGGQEFYTDAFGEDDGPGV
jgi:hypothetical protein